jgi:hypothetical protein
MVELIDREELECCIEDSICKILEKRGVDKYSCYSFINELVTEIVDELAWENFVELAPEQEEYEEEESGTLHFDEELGETYIY